MIKKITIGALLLVSPTEAIFGKGKNNKIVKPDAKNNGGSNIVGGKDQQDNEFLGMDEHQKLKKRITQLA